MTRFRLLALLLSSLTLVAGGPTIARADDPEPEVSDQEAADAYVAGMHNRWDRLIGVELTGGVENTPYGIGGVAVLIQPVRVFRIDLGGGASADGGRVGFGVGLVLPQDHFALTMRLGIAGGPLRWTSHGSPSATRFWNFEGFFNLQLGLEYRFDEGVLIRVFGGAETAMNSVADSCVAQGPNAQGLTGVCAPLGESPGRVFLGLSVGYMFDVIL